jgi:hypothetical protein
MPPVLGRGAMIRQPEPHLATASYTHSCCNDDRIAYEHTEVRTVLGPLSCGHPNEPRAVLRGFSHTDEQIERSGVI